MNVNFLESCFLLNKIKIFEKKNLTGEQPKYYRKTLSTSLLKIVTSPISMSYPSKHTVTLKVIRANFRCVNNMRLYFLSESTFLNIYYSNLCHEK